MDSIIDEWFTCISETLRYDEHPLRIVVGATEQADRNVRFWARADDRDFTPEQQARMSQIYDSFKPGLVQRIMEELGGQFGITREEGRGNEFYFTLPGGA